MRATTPLIADKLESHLQRPTAESALTENAEQQLAGLVEERDTLLRTGLYLPTDGIIRQLDSDIQNMLKMTNR